MIERAPQEERHEAPVQLLTGRTIFEAAQLGLPPSLRRDRMVRLLETIESDELRPVIFRHAEKQGLITRKEYAEILEKREATKKPSAPIELEGKTRFDELFNGYQGVSLENIAALAEKELNVSEERREAAKAVLFERIEAIQKAIGTLEKILNEAGDLDEALHEAFLFGELDKENSLHDSVWHGEDKKETVRDVITKLKEQQTVLERAWDDSAHQSPYGYLLAIEDVVDAENREFPFTSEEFAGLLDEIEQREVDLYIEAHPEPEESEKLGTRLMEEELLKRMALFKKIRRAQRLMKKLGGERSSREEGVGIRPAGEAPKRGKTLAQRMIERGLLAYGTASAEDSRALAELRELYEHPEKLEKELAELPEEDAKIRRLQVERYGRMQEREKQRLRLLEERQRREREMLEIWENSAKGELFAIAEEFSRNPHYTLSADNRLEIEIIMSRFAEFVRAPSGREEISEEEASERPAATESHQKEEYQEIRGLLKARGRKILAAEAQKRRLAEKRMLREAKAELKAEMLEYDIALDAGIALIASRAKATPESDWAMKNYLETIALRFDTYYRQLFRKEAPARAKRAFREEVKNAAKAGILDPSTEEKITALL